MKIILVLFCTLGLFVGTLIAAINVQAQEPSLQLCFAAAADYSPVYPTKSFPSTLKEVTAVFQLGKGESYKTLTATWIAVDVGNAAPPNYQIAKADLQLQGKDRGKLSYSQDNPLPLGKYRLDVKADGKPWKSVEFVVAPADKASDMKKPQDLLPLTKGKVWTYQFMQEAGEGAKISLQGITPDADGRVRTKVTMTVAETDNAGTHIELRRNNVLVFNEWWQFSEKGLVATKRKQEDKEVFTLDPPQVLLPWPLEPPRTWDYEAKDKSFKQTYQIWGPVPIKGPNGVAPGFVVLAREHSQFPAITAERHFLPGVGMVREVIIQALNGKMASHQEMTLTGFSQ